MKKNELKEQSLVKLGLASSFIVPLCCVGPLVLTLLGVSGAAILSKLHFLQFPMTIAVLAFFGVAGTSLYKKRHSCEPGSPCADPKTWKRMALLFWTGLAIAVIAISSPYWLIWWLA